MQFHALIVLLVPGAISELADNYWTKRRDLFKVPLYKPLAGGRLQLICVCWNLPADSKVTYYSLLLLAQGAKSAVVYD